jgi:integrase
MPDKADFLLSPEEVSKGEQAANAYLDSLKPGDARRLAEEALDKLATVISGGACGGVSFPWHQVRAYHSALALSILKERGAPANVEVLRTRYDESRKYQVVPEAFPPRQVQRMRISLKGVIGECYNLGFLSEDDLHRASPPNGTTPAKQAKGRTISDGEIRALLTACEMDHSVSGARDSLMISLAYQLGLKSAELIALSLDDLSFDSKTGQMTIRVKQPGVKRAKRHPLENQDLIALEDWLEARGRADGPLFCALGRRGQKVEITKMSASDIKELCDHRSEKSGVLPFAPNDIARSSPSAEPASKRRAREPQETERASTDSPLYGAGETEKEPAPEYEHIRFPYRVRTGN